MLSPRKTTATLSRPRTAARAVTSASSARSTASWHSGRPTQFLPESPASPTRKRVSATSSGGSAGVAVRFPALLRHADAREEQGEKKDGDVHAKLSACRPRAERRTFFAPRP